MGVIEAAGRMPGGTGVGEDIQPVSEASVPLLILVKVRRRFFRQAVPSPECLPRCVEPWNSVLSSHLSKTS